MSKEYFIFVKGNRIPVDEETYRAFKRPAWAEKRRRLTRSEKERSLDIFMESGFDPAPDEQLIEEIVEDKLLLEMLQLALRELTQDERALIDEIFYTDKSERQVAREMHVHRNTLAYQKEKILDKLKKYFGLS